MGKLTYKDIPPLLKQIPSCPLDLYYNGDSSLLKSKSVTIVGTRSITKYGEWVIRYLLGSFLKDLNISVVSGLARGVDGYVHRVCLERNINTIAIVPGSMT